MAHDPLLQNCRLTVEELNILHEVAAALRMTASEFLSAEVHGTSMEEARGYLKAFVAHANDAQVRIAYYLIRALTEKKR